MRREILAQIKFVPATNTSPVGMENVGVSTPNIGYAIPVSSGFGISSNVQYGLRNTSTGVMQTIGSTTSGLANFPISRNIHVIFMLSS